MLHQSGVLTFTKMNGAGNDFLMVDNRDVRLRLTREKIARLCDRHRGVGGDGLIAVEPAEHGADFRMRYYNADGREAEMCGNGARCFARFAGQFIGSPKVIRFETLAGAVSAELLDENVSLRMGPPGDLVLGLELLVAGQQLTAHCINTGVPHAVVVVEDLAGTDVLTLGAALRKHEHFQPHGTNANFINFLGRSSLAIRTYERGVEGETLACGTGVCAAALCHHALTGDPAPIAVRVRGGDKLDVHFDKVDGGFGSVTLTGPADFVFEGKIVL